MKSGTAGKQTRCRGAALEGGRRKLPAAKDAAIAAPELPNNHCDQVVSYLRRFAIRRTARAYLRPMFQALDFCLPTRGIKVPDRPEWIHEVKYDGYRLRVERDGDRVRLITRGGYNWTKRYRWMVEAALEIQHKQFVLDGEAVILGVHGISDVNTLHSRKFQS